MLCVDRLCNCVQMVNKHDKADSSNERTVTAMLCTAHNFIMPLAGYHCNPCTLICCAATSVAAVVALKKYNFEVVNSLPCMQTTNCDLLSLISIQVGCCFCGCMQLAYCDGVIYGNTSSYAVSTAAYWLLKWHLEKNQQLLTSTATAPTILPSNAPSAPLGMV